MVWKAAGHKALTLQGSGLFVALFGAGGVLLAVIAMIGGWGFDGSQDASLAAKCDYAAVARTATHKAYPDYDTHRRLALINHGAFVEMHYPPPNGAIGGSPVIHIEKETCRVTAIFRTQ